ncbi:MAG: 2OG-Fe(II) oxygenase [Casimicrobiaceae bacterium]
MKENMTGDRPVLSASGRLKETRPRSFIYEAERALEPDVCREMIRRFEINPDQQYPGRIGQAGLHAESIKKSTDLRVSGREDWRDIDGILSRSLLARFGEFVREFPFFAANAFKDIGYNLQRTLPGDHYHWHVDGGPGAFSERQLVAIWYLNDVAGPGGETEFPLQQTVIRPREGKLLLFPPFWTHVHRGTVLEHGVKYIATTWICFA